MYHSDDNVLVGAPTGSGKTVTAELAVLRLARAHPGSKAVYIAPLKALVRERIHDWRAKFVSKLGYSLQELTGDSAPDMRALATADILATTPEKWDGVSRHWQQRSYVRHVGLVIIDEIHLLGEERGPILEVIVSRMRYIAAQTGRAVRIVGLSTALANAVDLSDWLGIPRDGLFNFKPSVRPVPLEVHLAGYPGKHYCPRMATMNKPAYRAIRTYSPHKPTLVFVSSRRRRNSALDLIVLTNDERERQFVRMDKSSSHCHRQGPPPGAHPAFGIGIHHAGLAEGDRSVVEKLFLSQAILVLVCTATLAWGSASPPASSSSRAPSSTTASRSGTSTCPSPTSSMMGHAGRPQFDDQGVAVFVHEPKKSFYRCFVRAVPGRSCLQAAHDHFNAEIVSGTIRHCRDAVDFLSWTTTTAASRATPRTTSWRPMAVLPAPRRCRRRSPSSSRRRWAARQRRLRRVPGRRRADADDDGQIASFYCEVHDGGALLCRAARRRRRAGQLPDLLRVLTDASEYDELPVRHNEGT